MVSEIVGKHIKVFYEDGTNMLRNNVGICTKDTSENVTLDNKIIISTKRIVRIEIL